MLVRRTDPEVGIAVLTVDRPEALNALMPAVLRDLAALVAVLAVDPTVRVVIVTGAGPKAFVAGADIASMASMNALEAEAFAALGQSTFDALAALPVPVIAAVHGFALGGGCELAMACDLVIAGPKARFGQPEVKLGVIPGFGGTQRLVRRLGMAVALDLLLTGRMVDAAEASRIGLVSRLVEGDALEAALAAAREIVGMGPVAVRLVKRAVHENADLGLAEAQRAERSLFALCFATDDQKEGMRAFLDKRPARFAGR